MSKTTDGGPAFPVERSSEQHVIGLVVDEAGLSTGMSLRDWFAGQASLPWIDAVSAAIQFNGVGQPDLKMIAEARARYRYLEADAMLAERERDG